MSDEEIVQYVLHALDEKRNNAEKKEYEFFFNSPPELQLQFYEYWCKAHGTTRPMPQFLKDFELENTG